MEWIYEIVTHEGAGNCQVHGLICHKTLGTGANGVDHWFALQGSDVHSTAPVDHARQIAPFCKVDSIGPEVELMTAQQAMRMVEEDVLGSDHALVVVGKVPDGETKEDTRKRVRKHMRAFERARAGGEVVEGEYIASGSDESDDEGDDQGAKRPRVAGAPAVTSASAVVAVPERRGWRGRSPRSHRASHRAAGCRMCRKC